MTIPADTLNAIAAIGTTMLRDVTSRPGVVRYRDLQPGDRFVFVYLTGRECPDVMTKAAGRWYRMADGRRFTTGATVTVRRVTP